MNPCAMLYNMRLTAKMEATANQPPEQTQPSKQILTTHNNPTYNPPSLNPDTSSSVAAAIPHVFSSIHHS